MELRKVCETLVGNNDNIDIMLEESVKKIFDNFEIFDENYRNTLCVKIIKHYFFDEIGMETYGAWRFVINRKMNEIMPFYNKLYESTLLEFNPLLDKDITTTLIDDITGQTKTSQTSSGSGISKFSDTPQGGLQGLRDDEYLTTATMSEDSAKGEGVNDVKQNERKTETVRGKDGIKSYSQLLKEFRETILNIDVEIIKDLSDCFMKIY